MKYYPVFLDMQGRQAVIIGGGKVAERKALVLIRAGACVTVVSPVLSAGLERLKEKELISHIPRTYRKGDISRAFVAIAATDSPEVNSRISKDAAGLVNVVDVPPLCNFIAPSVVQRGPLTFAISTGGASPAFSKTVRQEIEGLFGPEVGQYLTFLAGLRKKALARITDQKVRERFLKDLASAKTLAALRTKGLEAVRKKALARFASISG